MNIVMVEPDGRGLHIFRGFRLPRLGAVLLGTILRQEGHEVEVQAEVGGPLDRDALLRADLVGVSVITPTATRSYAVADDLRAAGVPVVIGGPHATYLPDEALEHADWVVRGEGEAALPALVAALERGGGDGLLAEVPNLVWRRRRGEVVRNAMAPPAELDALPAPNWSLVRAGVSDSGRVAGRTVPLQTSRGCPFDCTFCSVTDMFGRRMRYRSVDKVLDELRPHSGSGSLVFFYDDNFGASAARVRAICEGILREGIDVVWSAQVRADVARDPDLLALMRRSGAHTVFIGLESTDPATLQAMDKRQSPEKMRDYLRRIQATGIRIHGMFVLGFDQDTPETAAATVRFAIDERLASAQFLTLIPLPGTPVYRQMEAEDRIVVRDWSRFDGHHAVFRPKGFTMRGLQEAQIRAHDRFYSRRRLLGWLLRRQLVEVGINTYARRTNRAWKRHNGDFLRQLTRLDHVTPPARAGRFIPALSGPDRRLTPPLEAVSGRQSAVSSDRITTSGLSPAG